MACMYSEIGDCPLCAFERKNSENKDDCSRCLPCDMLDKCPNGRWTRTIDGYPIARHQTQLPL